MEASKFKNSEFVSETLRFTPYNSSFANTDKYYSGWIISNGLMPKLFYENEIKTETVNLDKDFAKYIDITANALIKKLGYDYSSLNSRLCYPGAEVAFILGDYDGTFTGKERISCISFDGEKDLGNGLQTFMTFKELREILGDKVDEPEELSMYGEYVTSVDIGNLKYTFSWVSDNYNSEKSSNVIISKIS